MGAIRNRAQTFYDQFITTGRLKMLHIGSRARGVLEEDIDQIINEMVEQAATRPAAR